MKMVSISQCQHFKARFGFGYEANKTVDFIGQDISLLLDEYLYHEWSTAEVPIFSLISDMNALFGSKDITDERKAALSRQRELEKAGLINWWLETLHKTPNPCLERMTLFWHNHFTSSFDKIAWPQLMYKQNMLLRQYALGSFADLLRNIYKDPAMLLYLDAAQNNAKKPNENFARELLELFTLGEGYYTERDIINAARAFTGWRYDIKTDSVIFNQNQYDSGVKEFLGKQGKFSADDIINILLDHPRTAEFIVEKFWKHFINNAPNNEYVSAWADSFRTSGYRIDSLLQTLAQSDVFWAEENRGIFIKSPIEFTIGLLRELELNHFDAYPTLASINDQLGQRLFFPPDVKGWRGGESWLNNTTLVLRNNFTNTLLRNYRIESNNIDTIFSTEDLRSRLLALPPVQTVSTGKETGQLLASVLLDPVYQLR